MTNNQHTNLAKTPLSRLPLAGTLRLVRPVEALPSDHVGHALVVLPQVYDTEVYRMVYGQLTPLLYDPRQKKIRAVASQVDPDGSLRSSSSTCVQ